MHSSPERPLWVFNLRKKLLISICRLYVEEKLFPFLLFYLLLHIKKCLPRALPSLNVPSAHHRQWRDLHCVLEKRWRALDCKIVFKMQRSKKLQYLAKYCLRVSSFSEQDNYYLSEKFLLVPLQLTKHLQICLHLNTANENNQLFPSLVISVFVTRPMPQKSSVSTSSQGCAHPSELPHR